MRLTWKEIELSVWTTWDTVVGGSGTAAGVFDVADPETTAVLCYASMHAFDHGFRGRHGPDDARLIRAAQQLFRRAAGVTGG